MVGADVVMTVQEMSSSPLEVRPDLFVCLVVCFSLRLMRVPTGLTANPHI